MRRFKLSTKLKEKAQAPLPTEIERPGAPKEPAVRKWLLRLITLAALLGVIYFVFKDIFLTEIDGLIEPEKITVQAPTDGTLITYYDKGDTVPPNKVIAKIYNPEVEESLQGLKETLKVLLKWKEELKSENIRRKEEIEENRKTATFSLLLQTPTADEIEKELRLLKEKEARLLEERELLKSQILKIKRLITEGAATQGELTAKIKQLTAVETSLADVRAKIYQLKEKLKIIRNRPPLKEKVETNPLLPQIATIDYQISSLRATIEKLSSKLSSSFISFPFEVRISEILPSGSFVSKGTNIITAIRPDRFMVTAFVEPKKASKIRIGERVTIVLPNGTRLKGEVVKFEPTLVLKPAVLVGPLEKRTLTLPVRIRILEEKEVRKIVYENMPVTVIFNNL